MIRLPARSIRAWGCPQLRVRLPPAWITSVIFIRRGRLHRRAHRARRPPPRPPPRSAAPAKPALERGRRHGGASYHTHGALHSEGAPAAPSEASPKIGGARQTGAPTRGGPPGGGVSHPPRPSFLWWARPPPPAAPPQPAGRAP